MEGIIYLIKSPSNKYYIGQTVQTIEKRWIQHCKIGSNCTLLKKAINKYGKDAFKIEVLVKCSVEHLDSYEIKFIELYDSLAPNGYNCTSGGESKKTLCNEVKNKIAKALRGKNDLASYGYVAKSGDKYRACIPKSWTPLSIKKAPRYTFCSKQEALDFISYYYDTHVKGKDIPTVFDGRYPGIVKKKIGCVYKYDNGIRARAGAKYLGTFDTVESAHIAIETYLKNL